MSRRQRWTALPVILLFGLVLPSCDFEPVAPHNQDGPLVVAPDQIAETASGRVAQGIAVALRDAGLRQKLLGHFRGSPYVDHALPVADYLTSTRGAPLSKAAAAALGMDATAFEQDILELDGYRISVPIAIDRVEWAGGADLLVAASDLMRSELSYEGNSPGYTLDGAPQDVPNARPVGPTLIYLEPSTIDWSSAGTVRADGEGDQGANTISDFYSEIIPRAPSPLDRDSDSPELSIAADQVRLTGGRKEAFRFTCTPRFLFTRDPSIDEDHDGLRDTCEEFFMTEFHPVLNFQFDELCGSRETHWTVHQEPSGWIAVTYLLAYHEDCGAGGHAGDAEFLIALLAQTGGYWAMDRLVTSAHYKTLNDHSRDNPWTKLEFNSSGLPYVYVAQGKHANYRTVSLCAHANDICGGNSPWTQWYSTTSRYDNIGTVEYQTELDPYVAGESCTRSNTYYRGIECFWKISGVFHGWQKNYLDVPFLHSQNYRSILEDFGLAHAVYSGPATGGGIDCPEVDMDRDGRIDPC